LTADASAGMGIHESNKLEFVCQLLTLKFQTAMPISTSSAVSISVDVVSVSMIRIFDKNFSIA
jgi:hypothetical protein